MFPRRIRFFAIMAFFFSSAMGICQEPVNSYRLEKMIISYRVPKELRAAFTRTNDAFVSDGDRVIYTTSFVSRGLLTDKSIGSFTMAIIAMPDELNSDHSITMMGEYFKTALVTTAETVVTSTYTSQLGEWLKIERHPVKDSSQVSGVLFYRVISDQHILFVGLGTQPPDWWPPSQLKKLLPAVEKVVASIQCTGGIRSSDKEGFAEGGRP